MEKSSVFDFYYFVLSPDIEEREKHWLSYLRFLLIPCFINVSIVSRLPLALEDLLSSIRYLPAANIEGILLDLSITASALYEPAWIGIQSGCYLKCFYGFFLLLLYRAMPFIEVKVVIIGIFFYSPHCRLFNSKSDLPIRIQSIS